MTSPTSPTRARADPRPPSRRTSGFTLIEVLLAVGVLSILVAAAAITFGGSWRTDSLDEAAARFATTLRMLRAEAAGTGRRFRLDVIDEDGRWAIRWEPQPLAQPGELIEFTERSWPRWSPTETVVIERSQRVGAGALEGLGAGPGEPAGVGTAAAWRQPVDFLPDGSSDSARWVLRLREDADGRRAVVELDGMSGEISVRVLTPNELAEDEALVDTSMGASFAR